MREDRCEKTDRRREKKLAVLCCKVDLSLCSLLSPFPEPFSILAIHPDYPGRTHTPHTTQDIRLSRNKLIKNTPQSCGSVTVTSSLHPGYGGTEGGDQYFSINLSPPCEVMGRGPAWGGWCTVLSHATDCYWQWWGVFVTRVHEGKASLSVDTGANGVPLTYTSVYAGANGVPLTYTSMYMLEPMVSLSDTPLCI
jgi:hypothetical protein